MNDILGDEENLALCETCHREWDLDEYAPFVVCEGCSGVYCRRICWTDHWCGPLTDRNGRLVKLGDVLFHYDDVIFHAIKDRRLYRVTEMKESFRKHGLAVGVALRSKDGQRIPLHTRLMEIRDG